MISVGYWGWSQGVGALRYILAIGVPFIAAVLWGTFRVPGEPAGPDRAPVTVPGPVRLLLELVIFGFAVWGLFDAGAARLALIFGAVVVIHYAISYDRIWWIMKH